MSKIIVYGYEIEVVESGNYITITQLDSELNKAIVSLHLSQLNIIINQLKDIHNEADYE